MRYHPVQRGVKAGGSKEGCCVSGGGGISFGRAVDFLASIVPTGSLLAVRGGKSGGGQHGGKELGRGVEKHSTDIELYRPLRLLILIAGTRGPVLICAIGTRNSFGRGDRKVVGGAKEHSYDANDSARLRKRDSGHLERATIGTHEGVGHPDAPGGGGPEEVKVDPPSLVVVLHVLVVAFFISRGFSK